MPLGIRNPQDSVGTNQGVLMKKITAILIAACLLGSGAFAFDMGAGGIVDYSYAMSFMNIEVNEKNGTKTMNGFNAITAKAFLDVQYAIVTLGVNASVGKIKSKTELKVLGHTIPSDEEYNMQFTYFNLGMFGKYPFSLGSVKLYPIAGFDFDFIVAGETDGKKIALDDTTKKNMNMYWVDFGLGADVPIALNGKLCIRPEGIFGIKMNRSDDDKTAKDNAQKIGAKYSDGAFKFNAGVGVIYKF